MIYCFISREELLKTELQFSASRDIGGRQML